MCLLKVSDTDFNLLKLSGSPVKKAGTSGKTISSNSGKIGGGKYSSTGGTTTTGRTGSSGSVITSDKNTTNFTQRQAKSAVAVKEILKKGKKYHFRHLENRSDQLLNETISKYEQ